MVIVFDMTTGEVEYQDGAPAREAHSGGMRCPGRGEMEQAQMQMLQLGLQEVSAEPAADSRRVAAILRRFD